ncbi:PKD domain-containing protein [Bacteroidia bacterium]|nr:PKD domain-containing protein [Bacteroidia bacterium]
MTFSIHIANGQLVADFYSDYVEGCSPVTIQFKNTSTGTKLRYLWSFGNGNVSAKENPQAIFYQPGKYTVSLEVTDTNGTKDQKTVVGYITVFKNPVADLSGTPLFGCAPLDFSLTNLSTKGDANFKSLLWDFGDGNTKIAFNPTHTYKTDGKFNISLLVVDSNNCEDKVSLSKYVEVARIPDVNFTSTRRSNCTAPFMVTFSDLSTKTKATDNYLWSFGDGTTSTERNPSHTYTTLGDYTVNLIITTKNACSTGKQEVDYVNIGSILVAFEADNLTICNPADVLFTNNTVPSGLTPKWDFGDGSISNGYHVTHAYTATGTYTVKLSIEQSPDCKAELTKTAYISVIDNPFADFTLNDSTSCKLPFTLISYDQSENKTSIDWYLDDTQTGQSSPNAQIFTEYGSYKYKLVAKNQYGCTDEKEVNIKIEPVEIVLSADVTDGCKALDVVLRDNTKYDGTVTSRKWLFGKGDSTTSIDTIQNYTYADTGVFVAELIVTRAEGCIGRSILEIKVGQKTNPTIKASNDSFCNQDFLLLENTTNLDEPKIEKLNWHIFDDFNPYSGDSLIKNAPFVENQDSDDNYRDTLKKGSGWYNAVLITEHNGCRDTVLEEHAFYVHDPLAKIESTEFFPCLSEFAEYYNTSKGADSIVWHIYTENAGFFTSNLNDIKIYREEHGDSELKLFAYNFESGCIDYDEVKIEFSDMFEADFELNGELCAPANVTFSAKPIDSSRFSYVFSWEIDDEPYSGGSTHQRFSNPGTHKVHLKVTQNETNCTDTATKYIQVTGPSVDGNVSFAATCPPLPITLNTAVNPNDYDSLYWDIEGRKIMITSIGPLTDTLFTPGQDTANHTLVKLVGIDSNGCTGIKTFPVKVEGPASAYIKIRRLGLCAAQSYIFNGEVPGFDQDDYTYEWDLGNGDTSQGRIASVTYDDAGTYTVKLKILEQNGCTSTLTEVININKERLNADFNADSLESDCPPLFVQFHNRSTSPFRHIKSFYWEFGDGTTSVEENPSKLYLKAGKFTVKLFVVDEWDCVDSIIYPDFVIVNGPEGSYDFDKKHGCVPLTVNFTSTTKRANYFEWDMGDGNVIENTANYTHTYTIPGRFIPLLILSDTFGCSYTLPPIDTIYVDPYPDPDYIYQGTCVNYPISFTAANKNDLIPEEFLWEMYTSNGIDTFYGENVDYTFYNLNSPNVRLTITSKNGCSNTIIKTLDLKTLAANFESKNPNNCVGILISLKNTTQSDTTITYTKWIIDGVEYLDFDPTFFGDSIGPVEITLIQENILGCKDTLNSKAIIIGDSIKPLDLEILRVTVNDDETIQLDYKESTTPDFRAYIVYKESNTGFNRLAKIDDIKNTSYLSIGNNTLARSYCYKVEVENTCGLLSDTLTDFKHCTIETDAQGGVNHNIVQWSPYIGWDSVSSYSIYRRELDVASVLQKIGTVDGDSTVYIDSLLYCNIEYSYKIEGIEASGNSQISFSDTANAMPEWEYTPPPNKLIRATVEDDLEILVEWDSVKNSVIPITTYVLEKSFDGAAYTKIEKTDNQTFAFTDKEVYVDDFSYYYRTYAIDECNDTTNFWNFGKTILLNADTSQDQRPELVWSHYEGWTEDVSYYAVEIKNPNNTFTELATFYYKDTAFIDLITDLNQRPDYCYRIVAYKELVDGEPQVVSVSNEDCSPVRSKIYYPNAFTPNNDNLNDYYVTPSEYIKEYHIMIFTRWGEKIFESFDLDVNWDGTYKGKEAQMDAFAVIVISTGVDGIRRVHKGTITLVR